jgi:hypothetical protein
LRAIAHNVSSATPPQAVVSTHSEFTTGFIYKRCKVHGGRILVNSGFFLEHHYFGIALTLGLYPSLLMHPSTLFNQFPTMGK